MPPSPDTQELQRRFRYDTPFWAGGVVRLADGSWRYPGPNEFRGVCQIVDKRKRSVPCIAHPWQLSLDEIMEAQRLADRPVRIIILKARKLGFSTWVAVKFLQRLTQFPLQHAIVTAQDTKTAGTIFDMAKHAYSHLPSPLELDLGFVIKPALIGSSFSPNGRKFLLFGEASRKLRMEGRTDDSLFEIDTAGAPEAGRGGTPNMLHLSEVARWAGQQASQKMLSQLNAVPYEPETMVVLESTANGLNHYYRRWNSAVEGSEDPDTGESYAPLFVPWWRDPSCAAPFPTVDARARFVETIGDTRRYGDVAEDEEAIAELYSLSPEQLAWRRRMIREQHEDNVQLFKQENPASPEEAFIGSGRTVFAGILVSRAIKDAEAAPAPAKGTLRVDAWETRRTRRGTIEVPKAVIWVPEEDMAPREHLLEVWEHPRVAPDEPGAVLGPAVPTAASSDVLLLAAEQAAREGAVKEEELGAGVYVAGADIAEGEVNTFSEGDFSVVQVFDHVSGLQVATHASRMDIHDLPLWLYMIGLYYNEAVLAPEANDMGLAVVDALHKDYRYRRIYRRKKIDRLALTEEKKPGWKTDRQTKGAMEATFGEALADGDHGLRDLRTARELTVYVVLENGKHGAQHGEHDDRLMAAMIAKRVMATSRPLKRTAGRGLRKPTDEITGW